MREFKIINENFKLNNNDLRDVKAQDNDEVIKSNYLKFGIIIETFGSLFYHY